MENAIEVTNVAFAYTSSLVVQEVSFCVETGAVTAIIGPNGSGKTTLLKLLLGILKPQKGTISVFGKQPKEARNFIGYVPQKFSFDRTFPLTVWEFLKFSHFECPSQKIEEYLNFFGMAQAKTALVGSLSGGQLQRVLLVRAMIHDPKILYLDEPSAGIDVGGEQTFYELVDRLHKQYKNTIVMVSHELDVVFHFATQVICLNKKLLCEGAPRDVLTPELLEQIFGMGATLYHHASLR
ncbi:MAG: hypothetical protein A3E07_01180 [Candidatus Wildermuthbacteria bacterium RIFCSPHIGHO2_12_FULL_45_9]|uniref:ABC transporter domain-containing protein n=1 Tax=Candidatus Wildermuthbacteria bacterium RIFCSPHIGHO2_02_FULL_45_25 TaxID=1802450 RepID=A0A1G2QYN1_9BACT|nr:MAG: hypothetical protein A2748_02220 [Candidatus Wildermuthbacteria bacterium RIFCSPHIGHO2_01_FULL_45_20]OHA65735.1 MAG: hypothetical protein A3C04_02360 [Candidatus Wildermuthbacteria bacterium RIFCSPHIGHO2_02_FULL_45_25]OHA70890.1 MAG: hypothetical protein A3E07_01180 [Candidatus Wildermuthbacteria bacterium RIFCSPHIGHO2_12_FULL_45_9]